MSETEIEASQAEQTFVEDEALDRAFGVVMALATEPDMAAMPRGKGFVDVEIRPFEEADGTLDAGYPNWRFPWTVIVACRAG